jgi:hypothetical protein
MTLGEVRPLLLLLGFEEKSAGAVFLYYKYLPDSHTPGAFIRVASYLERHLHMAVMLVPWEEDIVVKLEEVNLHWLTQMVTAWHLPRNERRYDIPRD